MSDIDNVLDVVRTEIEQARLSFSPDMVISDLPFLRGDDAEDLIYACGSRIGIGRSILENHFPFDMYFYPEPNLSIWPFVAVGRLFGWVQPESRKQPLTAREFAEILVALKQERDREIPQYKETPDGTHR
jgi:hypothetical protein